MGRCEGPTNLALIAAPDHYLPASAIERDAGILGKEDEERIGLIRIEHAVELALRQLRVGNTDLHAVVAVELARDVGEWGAAEVELSLPPRDGSRHFGRRNFF